MLFSTPFGVLECDQRFFRDGLCRDFDAPFVLWLILGKVIVDDYSRVNRLTYLASKVEGQRGRTRVEDVNVLGIWKAVVDLIKDPSKR